MPLSHTVATSASAKLLLEIIVYAVVVGLGPAGGDDSAVVDGEASLVNMARIAGSREKY